MSSLHFLWEDEKNKGADACLEPVLEAFVDCDNVKNIDRQRKTDLLLDVLWVYASVRSIPFLSFIKSIFA